MGCGRFCREASQRAKSPTFRKARGTAAGAAAPGANFEAAVEDKGLGPSRQLPFTSSVGSRCIYSNGMSIHVRVRIACRSSAGLRIPAPVSGPPGCGCRPGGPGRGHCGRSPRAPKHPGLKPIERLGRKASGFRALSNSDCPRVSMPLPSSLLIAGRNHVS